MLNFSAWSNSAFAKGRRGLALAANAELIRLYCHERELETGLNQPGKRLCRNSPGETILMPM